MECDVAVIGAGPAGLAAAARAKEAGAGRVILMDRDRELGGILQQCIHNGFGLHLFARELTGPEYADHFIRAARDAGVEIMLNTMVLELGRDRRIWAMNRVDGMMEIRPKAVVLAMGSRERNRGAVTIPGTRPAGVFTAGAAQRFVNMEGFMPGKRFVILGSGDVGLIMARRLTWEGAKVEAVLEILPFASGLTRNVVQCLNDQNIPLYLGHTVVDVHGEERVEAVTAARVDESFRPIPGTERDIPCDTLLLSIGLIPENELTRGAGGNIDPVTGGPVVTDEMETSIPGVFACGNVVHIHDLVDNVTRESWLAGEGAARLVTGGQPVGPTIRTTAGEGIRYVVPHILHLANLAERKVTLFMRVKAPAEHVRIEAVVGGTVVHSQRERVVRPAEMVSVTLPPGRMPANSAAEEMVLRVAPEKDERVKEPGTAEPMPGETARTCGGGVR
ncbi:MAG: NAD(P)/FAD-dependent oxidoreductase [Firmicutes bacterium]|nr:NAD(P)/FAD-dependent oxidoreductase [Bacillota bacterium]